MAIHEDDRNEIRERLNKCMQNLLKMKAVLLQYEGTKHFYSEAAKKIENAYMMIDDFKNSPMNIEKKEQVNKTLESMEQYLHVIQGVVLIIEEKDQNVKAIAESIKEKLDQKDEKDDETGDEWVHILHLSDLHFGICAGQEEKNKFSGIVNEDLLYFFEEYVETGKRIDVVAITGDIAYHAKREEYNEFKEWLKKLCGRKCLNIKIKDRVIMCPGNHDKEYDANSEYEKITEPSGDNGSEKALTIEKIGDRQDQFSHFNTICEQLGINSLKNLSRSEMECVVPYVMETKEIKGIRFVVLNSAWNSFPSNAGYGSDHGSLFLGRSLLFSLLKHARIPKRDTTVMLFHHPLGWLHESEIRTYGKDQDEPSAVLVKRYADVILNGHAHGDIEPPDILANKTVVFDGGTLYDNKSTLSQFEIISINTKEHYCRQKVVIYNNREQPEHPIGWEMVDEKYPQRIYYGAYREIHDLILRYSLGELTMEEVVDIAKNRLPKTCREAFKTILKNIRDYQIREIVEKDIHLQELINKIFAESEGIKKVMRKTDREGEIQ